MVLKATIVHLSIVDQLKILCKSLENLLAKLATGAYLCCPVLLWKVI